MPTPDDEYIVEIKPSHIDWGRYRYTNSRDEIAGEAYVKIPRREAKRLNIKRGDLYTAIFKDGFPSFTVRAAGNSFAGDIYPKQFQGDGDLKAFGYWYEKVGAQVGDCVRVKFIATDVIEFTLL